VIVRKEDLHEQRGRAVCDSEKGRPAWAERKSWCASGEGRPAWAERKSWWVLLGDSEKGMSREEELVRIVSEWEWKICMSREKELVW
jgi:hypothetical protein